MANISQQGRERLIKLARFLSKLDNDKFDIRRFVSKAENNCATVACALGWLPTVFPEYFYKNTMYLSPKNPDNLDGLLYETASIFFDISISEAQQLFSEFNPKDLKSYNRRIRNPKPITVARQIYRFLKTKGE